MIPEGCQVSVPPGGFQPWEVYKVLKVSSKKIKTPGKFFMGAQTLVFSGMEFKASSFTCQQLSHLGEWRAKVGTETPLSVIEMRDYALPNPNQTLAHCRLDAISLYQSSSAIPGLRLDYVDCVYGTSQKATVLVGLKKVPDGSMGVGPGLANFFRGVCGGPDAQSSTDAYLRFGNIEGGLGHCDIFSATMQTMQSEHNCFDSATVFTLLDRNNYFPLLTVTDSDWNWILANVPKAPHPFGAAGVIAATANPSPCAKAPPPPKEVFPKVYGHLVADRVSVAIPEFNCSSYASKFCHRADLLSTNFEQAQPTYTPCTTCYDCAYDDIAYAIAATILAFFILHPIHCHYFSCSWKPGATHSKKIYDVGPPRSLRYTLGFFLLTSLVWSVFAYLIVNMANYLVVVKLMEKEMCLKIFNFQTNNETAAEGRNHFSLFGSLDENHEDVYSCHNEVCPWRLVPLVLTTWLSLYVFFFIWRNRMIREGQNLKRAADDELEDF